MAARRLRRGRLRPPRRIRAARSGSALPQQLERLARPRDHHEVRQVEHGRVVAPRGNFCKRVGAEDEEKLRRLAPRLVKPPQRVGRVRRARPLAARRRTPGIRDACRRPARPSRTGGRPTPAAAPSGAAAVRRDEQHLRRAPARWRAASAAATWPSWTGSNVPPRTPVRPASGGHASLVGVGGAPGHPTPQRLEQRRHALAGDGRDREDREPPLAGLRPQASSRSGSSSASILLAATSCGRSSSSARNSSSSRRMTVEVVRRVAPRGRRHVHQVDQDLRALDVAEELVAEAVARGARLR